MKYLKASVIYKVFSQLLRRWRSRLYVFLVFSEGTIAYHRRLKIPSVMSISCIITSGPKGTNTKRRLAALTHPECGATALSLFLSFSLCLSVPISVYCLPNWGGIPMARAKTHNGTCSYERSDAHQVRAGPNPRSGPSVRIGVRAVRRHRYIGWKLCEMKAWHVS